MFHPIDTSDVSTVFLGRILHWQIRTDDCVGELGESVRADSTRLRITVCNKVAERQRRNCVSRPQPMTYKSNAKRFRQPGKNRVRYQSQRHLRRPSWRIAIYTWGVSRMLEPAMKDMNFLLT